MLLFFAGLLAGGFLGVLMTCLCVAAGNADRAAERAGERSPKQDGG